MFGSFVTTKPEPGDLDVFLLMEDTFDVSQLLGEVRLLFDHPVADAHFGASVFWMRRLAALGGEQEAIEFCRPDAMAAFVGSSKLFRRNHDRERPRVSGDDGADRPTPGSGRRLRQVETNPANYRAAAGGFLVEIDRMQLEVREYLSVHPADSPRPPEFGRGKGDGDNSPFPIF